MSKSIATISIESTLLDNFRRYCHLNSLKISKTLANLMEKELKEKGIKEKETNENARKRKKI